MFSLLVGTYTYYGIPAEQSPVCSCFNQDKYCSPGVLGQQSVGVGLGVSAGWDINTADNSGRELGDSMDAETQSASLGLACIPCGAP